MTLECNEENYMTCIVFKKHKYFYEKVKIFDSFFFAYGDNFLQLFGFSSVFNRFDRIK